jgi:hypothetical protein
VDFVGLPVCMYLWCCWGGRVGRSCCWAPLRGLISRWVIGNRL